jgi:hypothetical protein
MISSLLIVIIVVAGLGEIGLVGLPDVEGRFVVSPSGVEGIEYIRMEIPAMSVIELTERVEDFSQFVSKINNLLVGNVEVATDPFGFFLGDFQD